MRRIIITSALLALAAMLWPLACALHNPPPVDPNYPDPVPIDGARDAGRE